MRTEAGRLAVGTFYSRGAAKVEVSAIEREAIASERKRLREKATRRQSEFLRHMTVQERALIHDYTNWLLADW